ncbi:MAG TPA: hypothetical protein VK422_21390 [Pyrinomonadaceae bacterium]|nr:hypothetical protein [Pyrinomonadaceae bacterium]
MGRIPDDLPRIDLSPPPPIPVRQADVRVAPTCDGAASRAGEVQLQGQTRRSQLESQLPANQPDPAELARQKRELALDLTQMALDIVGLVDPTPISDGSNGIVSLFRGDFFGAGISALGMIPYVGDLAKVGKLGKFVKTMERVVDIARVDARFADEVRPVLNQIRGALDQIPFDKLPDAAREPLQALKGKVDDFFSATPTSGGDTFTGTLRGARVELPGVTVRSISYTKRSADELATLRNAFNSTERAGFVRSLANDPAKVAQLRRAGLNDDQIRMLADGKIPQGWQVHHKLPLDDGGTNDYSNLVLIKNEPYHKVITNAQNSATRGMTEGQTRLIEQWPIPPGFVYPPTP